jgi:hypothetical protein
LVQELGGSEWLHSSLHVFGLKLDGTEWLQKRNIRCRSGTIRLQSGTIRSPKTDRTENLASMHVTLRTEGTLTSCSSRGAATSLPAAAASLLAGSSSHARMRSPVCATLRSPCACRQPEEVCSRARRPCADLAPPGNLPMRTGA